MHTLPNRQSNRLKRYNYSRDGLYFVTITTQYHEERFGKIRNGEMTLNDAGKMVLSEWSSIPTRFPTVELDAFVIMPNHIHGIIILNDSNELCGNAVVVNSTGEYKIRPYNLDSGCRGEPRVRPQNSSNKRPKGTTSNSIGRIVQSFKSITTKRYINGVKMGLAEPFHKRLWQRNYYDHIIRNEKECAAIEQYIINNPQNWRKDRFRKKKV